LLEATDGSIKPIALIFLEIAEDGLAKIKNSNSTFQNVDISNNPNAEYTHDLILNGTISIKINAAGGEAVTIESTILTPEQLAEINNLVGGEMDSVNGYTINLYQLIYKLILWEYINSTYTITLKPFVIYANITNVNDNTTALNYTIPTSKITANKEVISITTDPNLIIFADGTIRNCENLESNYTGPGQGNIYLIGNYTKLESINQSISEIDFLSDNLKYLNLSSNAVNISNAKLANVYLIELSLNNTNSIVSDQISKMSDLTKIALDNCVNSSIIQSYLANLNQITFLSLNRTNSNITDLMKYNNLNYLNLGFTESIISNLATNKITYLDLEGTSSTLVINYPTLISIYCGGSDVVINDTLLLNHNSIINFRLFSNLITLSDSGFQNILNSIAYLVLNGTDSTITNATVKNAPNLFWFKAANTPSIVTETASSNNLRVIDISNSNTQTVTENNELVQSLVNNPRTSGNKQLTYDNDAGLDQSNLDILTNRGWDLIALT
jgi:hypothetical protein